MKEVSPEGGLGVPETQALLKAEEEERQGDLLDDQSLTAFTEEESENFHRQGLTPDWVVEATCHVFQLQLPTVGEPRILGLCDPCSNDLVDPNVPAERLYDKLMDGLLLSNSWEGFYILLNPDFDAQVNAPSMYEHA